MNSIIRVFRNIKLKRKQRQEVKNKMKIFNTRIKELEAAMNILISEHMTPASIEELYLHISYYVVRRDKWEKDYCKDYIRKKMYKGYHRYDDERLR